MDIGEKLLCESGASALVNDLSLTRREIFFMFPVMLLLTGVAQVMLRRNWRLERRHGYVLLGLYAAYLAASFLVFKSR